MRTMSSTERAYTAGIIDGEGCIEFKWAHRLRKDRKGHPTYNTLICRMEVSQVDGRLIDYLMVTTDEGHRDIKKYPDKDNWQDQHRWRCGYHAVYRILKQVFPYLVVKKEKAKLVVDHYDKKFKEKKYGKGGFGTK
tara:strand:- start:24 stop:431 length:408 start_codon:yes stop_codon:yes gene_type:complete